MNGKHTPPKFGGGKKVKMYLQESKAEQGVYHLYLRWNEKGKRKKVALNRWVLSRERLKVASSVEREQSRTNAEIAEMMRAKMEQELIEGTTGIVSAKRKRGRAFLPYYDKLMAGKGDKTKEQYKNTRAYIVEFAGEDLVFGDITREWCKDFLLFLSERVSRKTKKQLSAHTRATAFKLLKAVIHDAIAEGIMSSDPTYKITPPKGEDKLEYLGDDEIERLEAHYRERPSDEVLRAFLFSCYAGLRLSDIESLTWGSVKRSSESAVSIYYKQQKTQQSQAIPLSRDAIRLLGVQPKGAGRDTRVFGLRYRADTGTRIKQIGFAVLGRDITYHISRHTFAMRALERGVNAITIKEMLGHADIQTTMKYARASKRSLLNDVDKLNG
ncbi:MAG: site-specific integrase [Porphyromonas sp.]|nr:site-specific integrase [Porphyromonas sp.]